MEVFTLEEWENNFDALFKRVEEGETIGKRSKRKEEQEEGGTRGRGNKWKEEQEEGGTR